MDKDPNIANLKHFFKNEAIAKLWWGPNGFYDSTEMKSIVEKYLNNNDQKLYRRAVLKKL